MIKALSLSQLAQKTDGKLYGSDVIFSRVSTDTRTIKNGDLYIALKGEKFNGFDYIDRAVQADCSAVVMNSCEAVNESLTADKPLLLVSDSIRALGEAASLNRLAMKGPVIGLTGSSGKTTTKNMIATILSEEGETCSTEGNFNNEIGVPLTLLNIDERHDFAVVEMGARSPGDISYLSGFVQPDVAILLNVGVAHIDIFGSYESIVATKSEIFDALKPDGIAIINADDPAINIWQKKLGDKQKLSFSVQDEKADIYASEICCDADSSSFNLHYQDTSMAINLPMPGLHNVSNSLAAAAAAIAVGIAPVSISKGLTKLISTEGRLHASKLSQNLTLIDDSYNANPASMKASLDVLSLRSGYKVAVLGEMAELGALSESLHIDVAKYAAKTSIDKFYFIGRYAELMSACVENRSVVSNNKQDIADLLFKSLEKEESVLVKASRSACLDELVEMIKERAC